MDLCDLGLSSYEARAYRGLLELGTANAREVSEGSGVPMGRIYDAMNGLEAKGAVRSHPSSRPTTYVAVEPTVLVDRLIDARRREFQARIDRLEAHREEVIDGLEERVDPDDRFWTAAIGAENALALLTERIDSADDRVVVVANTVSSQFDLGDVGEELVERLAAALDRGVAVSILLSEQVVMDVPDALVDRAQEPPFGADRFEVRMTEEAYGNVNVVDRNEVCIEVTNPMTKGELFGMIDLKNPAFASAVESTFEDVWAEATPVMPEDVSTVA